MRKENSSSEDTMHDKDIAARPPIAVSELIHTTAADPSLYKSDTDATRRIYTNGSHTESALRTISIFPFIIIPFSADEIVYLRACSFPLANRHAVFVVLP